MGGFKLLNHVGRCVVASVAAVLVGCGGDPAVTADEGTAFTERVRVEVPGMQGFAAEDENDLNLVEDVVCSSLASGQSYENVSETVSAYTGFGVAGSEVDDIIRIAVETACPEQADQI